MKRILVALDGSPRAPLVLAAAAQLAEQSGARLVLFRAVGLPPELPRELYTASEIELEQALQGRARVELERLATSLPPARLEAIMTELGTPWDSIVRTGRELEADLIVLGSHGYRGLDHLLGTTAAKVVNHADRNVFVVRTAL